ncbi:MAG: ABC transporter permease [Fimbriimonadaceae bacterium]|nr:ABC transporter permease [Chitinophagales bacterium]
MKFIGEFGQYCMMLGHMFKRPERWLMYRRELFRQMYDIGIGSLVIVLIISIFIGAVTAVQSAYQLYGTVLVPTYYLGLIVRDTIIFELAPTVTCLILAGKIGSNIASELGTMRITEQIDALEIMGVTTESYLIAPRILAAVIMIPLLVVIAAFSGITGGMFASTFTGYGNQEDFMKGLITFYEPFDVQLMLIKAFVFAFTLTSIACWKGFYVKGGALEIGKASTQAVVLGCIFILLADYIIAELLL